MTLSAQIRQLLADSPSTVAEVAAVLGVHRRVAQVGVWVLSYTGQAVSHRTVPNQEGPGRGHRRTVKLFELTPHGRFLVRRDRLKRASYPWT